MNLKYLIVVLVILASMQGVSAASYDIVIARGDLPVDSLVAQVYTQQADIPLVIVTRTGLSYELEIELEGYRAQGYKNVLIIGGEEAVPIKVENHLNELNYTITRLWDWNRYGTAARVAVTLWEKTDTVVVAPADQKGTLIAAARTAIDFKGPLLLTETEKVPDETKTAIQELGATRIILAGNVSESARDELSALGGVQQTKIAQITIIQEQTTNTRGILIIGVIIGGLAIFLLTSLFSVGLLKRRNSVKPEVLSEDEKKLIGVIAKAGNSIKQEDIPKKTGFSRPKITRIVASLEKKGYVYKDKDGKTFVIRLK